MRESTFNLGSSQPPRDIAHRLGPDRHAHLCARFAELDWFDVSLSESFDTLQRGSNGVMYAAAVFPILMVSFTLTAGIISSGIDLAMGRALLYFVVLAGPTAILCWLASILPIGICMGVIGLANACLGYRLSARTQIALLGGMTGFLTIASFAIVFFDGFSFIPAAGGLAALAGVMGHVGAVWTAAKPKSWRDQAVRRKPFAEQQPKLQLRHLFGLTTLAAIVVMLAKIDGFRPARYLVCYGVVQVTLLLLDALYCWLRQKAEMLPR